MNATALQIGLKQVPPTRSSNFLEALVPGAPPPPPFGRVNSDTPLLEDTFDSGLAHRMGEAQDERHAFLSLLIRIQRSG